MLELERTYLLKYLPEGCLDSPHKLVVDTYYPLESKHPVLRLRQSSEKFELTKKTPVEGQNASAHTEETIKLSSEEAAALRQLSGKVVSKIRYYYPYKGRTADVDIFQGDLSGLILVDLEFDDAGSLETFLMPDFCLADVTEEEFLAGGMLCGKKYADISENLARFRYTRISTVPSIKSEVS